MGNTHTTHRKKKISKRQLINRYNEVLSLLHVDIQKHICVYLFEGKLMCPSDTEDVRQMYLLTKLSMRGGEDQYILYSGLSFCPFYVHEIYFDKKTLSYLLIVRDVDTNKTEIENKDWFQFVEECITYYKYHEYTFYPSIGFQ